MKCAWIRSQFFNAAFFGVTGILCVLYIPALLLPRQMFIALVRFWLLTVTFFEYAVLGLRYEIEGLENLPKSGAYIIAAKHQSMYETFKLRLLFNDPAIILKKELLSLPFFGSYLKKSGVIAIDRSTPERALRSIQDGAQNIAAQGRPIVIFPQGTRVGVDQTVQEKPYKPGVARIQDITGLAIVPVALNSGLFWPKGGWLKSPGTVTFKLLPAIPPGKDRHTLMRELENDIESESARLVAQARNLRHTRPASLRVQILAAFILLAAFAFYTAWWGAVAKRLSADYDELNKSRPTLVTLEPLKITGYPGKMRIHRTEENISGHDGNLKITAIDISGWPFPYAPIHIHADGLEITSFKWLQPLVFNGFDARIDWRPDFIDILDSSFAKDSFLARAVGTVDISQDMPQFDLKVNFKNHKVLVDYLSQRGIVDDRTAQFMVAGFNALADKDGMVTVPVTQNGRKLYAGPFAFAELPESPVITGPPASTTEGLPAPSR